MTVTDEDGRFFEPSLHVARVQTLRMRAGVVRMPISSSPSVLVTWPPGLKVNCNEPTQSAGLHAAVGSP